MPLLAALGFALVLFLIFGPQLWVRYVLRKHGGERPDFPGTGGELARHLLDELSLTDVKVETTAAGDHYDASARAVRLLPQHHDGRSVAAVAIAAHEVSHALQHSHGERGFIRRLELVGKLVWIERAAMAILFLTPLVFLAIKVPAVAALEIGAALALLGVGVLVHIITLPVEFDASFAKALPILEEGRYLSKRDMPAARHVLRAAALTYVAGALVTLLNVGRWLRVFI